jgi:CheY-like chemotaxis protein
VQSLATKYLSFCGKVHIRCTENAKGLGVQDDKDSAVQPTAEPQPVIEDEAPEALRILAAEDNLTNQLVLKTLLAQAGLSVTMVDDGQAAVDSWERNVWDLILMDVRMPVMDGPSATATIRARELATGRARTPIVAVTANTMPHEVTGYYESGMDGLVAKPIAITALFEAIGAALHQEASDTDRSSVA